MPQLPPWNSEREPCHHTNSECVYGASIIPTQRREGGGGKPLCSLCERLNRVEDRFDRERN